jgi:hypothetical protein
LQSMAMTLGAASIFMDGCTALSDSTGISFKKNFLYRNHFHVHSLAFASVPKYSFTRETAATRPRLPSRAPVSPLRPNSAPLARRILSQPTVFVAEEDKPRREPLVVAIPRADKPPYAMNTQQLVYVWLCRQVMTIMKMPLFEHRFLI